MRKLFIAFFFISLHAFGVPKTNIAENALELLKNDCKTALSGGVSQFTWSNGFECEDTKKLVSMDESAKRIPLALLASVLINDKGGIDKKLDKNSLSVFISNKAKMDVLYEDYNAGVQEFSFPKFTREQFNNYFKFVLSGQKDVVQSSEKPLMQCGPFLISSSDDGFAHINHTRPETQKFTFLREKDDYSNLEYQWMVPTNTPGHWYGMDYVKRNGKAILNVQIVQANMNAPRVYGSYDCQKIK